LALGCLFVFLSEDWEMPREWICNSADDLAHKNKSILSSLGMSDIAGSAGAFLGVALGAWLMRKKVGFDTGGKCCKRVVIGIVGLLILGGLYFLFNKFVLTDQTSGCLDCILNFTAFFLLLFFIFFLYPLFFRKIKCLS
jgi:Ca2+/Na+ antiporter